MKKDKSKKSAPVVNMFDFDSLISETMKNAGQLTEFFRLNLIYYQLISGRGLEFDKTREYVSGDDVRRIDWNIFARTGKVYTKIFKEERVFDIIIILDVSNSMLLGTNQYTKSEFGALVAGTLAFAAMGAGDNIGGGTFSAEKQNMIEAEGDFYNLLHTYSKKENYGGVKNWAKLTNDLLANYSEDSIVFIISDFINAKPDEFLPELANQFTKVYGIMVRDPIDQELPSGVGKMYLKDPASGKVVLTDVDKLREEYRILAEMQAKTIQDLFRQYDQKCFKIVTGENFASEFVKAMGDETVELS